MTIAGAETPSRMMFAAWYGLAVLVIATIGATLDRQILVLVTEQLKGDLGLSDTQIGALNGVALTLVAGLATFPMGWLADRVDRRALLSISLLIWCASTAAIGFTETYLQLFLWCMGAAVGGAVLGPISYSLIPDLFPEGRRVLANYVFYVAAAVLGASGGLVISGAALGAIEGARSGIAFLPTDFETWRVAMLCAALPGPLIAGLVMLIRLKPRPKHGSPEAEIAPALIPYFRRHWRSTVGVFLGFGLIAAASGTVGIWVPVVLIRDLGEAPSNVGLRLGGALILATIAGVAISGWLFRTLRPRWGALAAVRIAQMGGAAAILTPPLTLLAQTPLQIYMILSAFHVATTVALSLSPTVLQDIAPRLLRGRVVAVGGMLYMMLVSISPVIVGIVSDLQPVGSKALLLAMLIVSLPCFALGVAILRFGEKTLPGTMADAAQ